MHHSSRALTAHRTPAQRSTDCAPTSPDRESTPLTNKHQPGHKFLCQLLNKSPMCLLNEVCRHHKLKPEYTLLHTTGPDHAKIFCVSLQFGEKEKYIGEGSSIKNAQRTAATCALENTELSFPTIQKVSKPRKEPIPCNGATLPQTPASELNTLLMKNGIQPKYELTVERVNNENLNIHNHMHYPTLDSPMSFYSLPKNSFPRLSSNTCNNHSQPLKINGGFAHKYPPPPVQCMHMPIPATFNSNFMFPSPYMYSNPYIHPNHLFSNRPHLSSHQFNESFNYGFIHNPYNAFRDSKPNQNGQVYKWNAPNAFFPPPNLSNPYLNRPNFEAKIEFNGQNFCGQGSTAKAARHSAANEALKYVKNQKQTGDEKKVTSPSNPINENGEQSPISLVYEIASRNRYKVLFELVHESGQIHMPQFQMRCLLYSTNPQTPLLTTYGEDRSKKAAKKIAAESMLKEMKATLVRDSPRNKASNDLKGQLDTKQPNNNMPREPIKGQASSENENASHSPAFNLESSCKYVTLLYKLARNLCIESPSYRVTTMADSDQLTKDCMALFTDDDLPESANPPLVKAECLLQFDQRLPQQFKCTVKAVGFGATPRMARSMSTYICLIMIGIQPPTDANDSTSAFRKFLKFSLSQNSHLSEHANYLDGIAQEDAKSELSEFNNLPPSIIATIELNLQFVIHILGKLYLFILKDSSKSIDSIFEKLENTIKTFYSSKCPEMNSDEIESKCASLKQLTALLDGSKYWSHLSLLSSLVILGLEDHPLLSSKPLLQFKPHSIESETKLTDGSSQKISIIGVHCSQILVQTLKFGIIKHNFVNFGLGSDTDSAQEIASLWTLKNLSYLARKQMIETEFEIRVTSPVKQESSPTSVSKSDKSESVKPKSKSKPSQGQVTSKQCVSRLFEACAQMNIHKPTFEVKPWCSQSSESKDKQNLFLVECALSFVQELPEPLSSTLIVRSIGPNRRQARTIGALLALNQLGLSTSEHKSQLFELDNFDTHVRLSIDNNPLLSFDNLFEANLENTSELLQLVEVKVEEFSRNVAFVVRLLQTIYRPFLKNHKMGCPSHLFGRVEEELFEYHNQQQQIMDQSSTFDRCSEHIRECVRHLMQQYDGAQFWHHLQLLAAIVGTLTADLRRAHPVFSFQCQLCPSVGPNGQSPIPVAIISVHSHLPSANACGITKKSFLSFAASQNDQQAQQLASYKALRHLAISPWK